MSFMKRNYVKKIRTDLSQIMHNIDAPKTKARADVVERCKLICVCQTPYDPRRDYIGCAGGCGEWFHPECVNVAATVNEDSMRTLETLVCAKDEEVPEKPAVDVNTVVTKFACSTYALFTVLYFPSDHCKFGRGECSGDH